MWRKTHPIEFSFFDLFYIFLSLSPSHFCLSSAFLCYTRRCFLRAGECFIYPWIDSTHQGTHHLLASRGFGGRTGKKIKVILKRNSSTNKGVMFVNQWCGNHTVQNTNPLSIYTHWEYVLQVCGFSFNSGARSNTALRQFGSVVRPWCIPSPHVTQGLRAET